MPNVGLCVYEKDADSGGIGFENRCPGCACDVSSATFEPNKEWYKEWSTFYASAPEIHRYWKQMVCKYDCMKYIKLMRDISEAVWNEQTSRWHSHICEKVRDVDSGSTYSDQCDPNIPGLHGFKGKLLHNASWDESYDYRVISVIRSGSSDIQIVPATLPRVAHLDHYIRDIELELQSVHGTTIIDTPEQAEAEEVFLKNLRRRLSRRPELLGSLVPPFPPACRRLTPGPGYLEALTEDNVNIISSNIVQVDANGIVTADRTHHPTDVIVIGCEGVTLAGHWEKTPEAYISIMVDGFPNYFISLGPNAALGEGNQLPLIDQTIDCFTFCIQKTQRDNIQAIIVNKEAVNRFPQHCGQYFSQPVFRQKRRRWYRAEDGRNTDPGIGSSLHSLKVLAYPRWEDFMYEYTEDEKNEAIQVGYLDDDHIDFPWHLLSPASVDVGA
ncbi:hypothetical protein BDV23DRAFT_177308 [Aspergillus alliaceus]|uniref:Uncharacterized protein n=1 Tax=Petromyces alliaceus TaxID=209559 RepID=A0A5N7BQJ0_PETAA|nr:hypothetical protein BDV23DRAFT_177308 [Aspergillus alliaceus]